MGKVVITDPNFAVLTDSIEKLREAGHEPIRAPFPVPEVQLLPFLGDAEAVVSGPDPIGRMAMEAAPSLKLIARFGVGVDNIDIPAASEHRVIVTNAVGMNADAVADFAFCLMLALSRDICTAATLVPEGKWEAFRGVELWGKTLGVLGTGHIGRRVIRRAYGFAMNIVAYDVLPSRALEKEFEVRYLTLDAVLEQADYLTIHVPRLPETIGLIGEKQLQRMKSSAFLINTARGGIVDEAALLKALQDKRIAGAGLDVFAEEPPRSSSLFDLPNVIATPHIASSTSEAICNVDQHCLHNVLRVLAGQEPLSPVNYPFQH
jgi:D-3-phosphoglycerate dehydrogenase